MLIGVFPFDFKPSLRALEPGGWSATYPHGQVLTARANAAPLVEVRSLTAVLAVIWTNGSDVCFRSKRNRMTSARKYWLVAIALVLTMLNAVPTFAATGVIWGT